MEIHLVSKNDLIITDAIKQHVEKKIEQPLKQRYEKITTLNIVMQVDRGIHHVEATLHFNGQELHASAEEKDLYESIDELSRKLFAILNKIKERQIDNHR